LKNIVILSSIIRLVHRLLSYSA